MIGRAGISGAAGAFFAIAALAVSITGSAFAQQATPSPQWSSDQIRGARPIGPVPTLVFSLHTEDREKGAVVRTQSSTVALAPSYTAEDVAGDHALDDYDLCRSFSWSEGKTALHSGSCYSLPGFSVEELANRRGLAAMIVGMAARSGKPVPIDPDPYWREAELRVAEPSAPPLSVSKTGDVTEYRLKDEVVVRLVGSAAKLDADERRSLVRYLTRHVQLHPQVRADLAKEGDLPARIEIETLDGGTRRREVLTLSDARRTTPAFPLPAGLVSDLRTRADAGATPVDRGLKESLAAIDGRAKIARPTFDDLITRMQSAAGGGRPVEVLLSFLNLSQQYPSRLMGADRSALAGIAPLVRSALRSPDVAPFWQASLLAGDPRMAGDRQAAARYLVSASSLDSLPFGTFRLVTLANLVRVSPQPASWNAALLKRIPRPIDAYWSHIAAYPWASAAYKDAGDASYEAFDPESAWLAYDLGRAIDPDWRAGPMGSVAQREAKLRADLPDFF